MVDFELRRGEIHAVLGENGAGKSTLMNILYGLIPPDAGEIRVKGKTVEIQEPRDAISLGINMVHQDFMLIPVFTVLENIILGEEERRGLVIDVVKAQKKILDLAERHNLAVDPRAHVRDLPVSVQQRVEILKALYRDAQILVLDEPTAVLTPQETEELFAIMRELASTGLSIIFVTHKLREVMDVADRITVMRAGKVIDTITPEETDERGLAEMMVGRQIFATSKAPTTPGEAVLAVRGLSALNDRGIRAFSRLSFQLNAGEVLGIAGVQGNGQSELVEALTGLRPVLAGDVFFKGTRTTYLPARRLFELGIGHIPEDRENVGLVKRFSVADNLILKRYYQKPFTRGGVVAEDAIASTATHLVQTYGIQPASIEMEVGELNPSNQQKVVLAREISGPVHLLIANQPTQGLDANAIELVHRYLLAKREQGCAILLVSNELDEIMALSDRIAVIYRGAIVAEMPVAEATREGLGMMMAGVTAQSLATRGDRARPPVPTSEVKQPL
jgi:simple sugar transport system ATP-binding protein